MNVVDRAIALVCQALLWCSTSVIFVILVANTILRYATGSSLQWANEVPELLFPWLVMSGVVLAAQRGAHITTSFLLDFALGPVMSAEQAVSSDAETRRTARGARRRRRRTFDMAGL